MSGSSYPVAREAALAGRFGIPSDALVLLPIRTEYLGAVEMACEGSPTYGIDHEMEHHDGREGLRTFRWGG